MEEEEENDYNWKEEQYQKRYIPDNERSPKYHGGGLTQSFKCPNCGSWNTGQSTYVDFCNSCDYSEGY